MPAIPAARAARYVLLVISLVALLIGAHLAGRLSFDDWWPWVAVATVLSILLTEPRYTNPLAGLLNSVATLAAIASADRTRLTGLWIAFICFAVVALVVSVLALVTRGRPQGTRFRTLVNGIAQARVLGFGVLLLDAFVSGSPSHNWPLVAAVVSAAVLTAPSLADGLASTRTPRLTRGSLRIVGSEAPNVLTVLSPEIAGRGRKIAFWLGAKRYVGQVTGTHADERGVVLILATTPDLELDALTSRRSAKYETLPDDNDAAGVVVAGTTPEELLIRPSAPLVPGNMLKRTDQEGEVLYQVTRTELVRFQDEHHYTTEPRVWAAQLGRVRVDGRIDPVVALPTAFDPVESVVGLTGHLPAGYVELGALAGTSFPVGFNLSDPLTGHLAVLGMSGMGKTSLVRRLAEGLSASNVVGVVDVAGEYSQLLGLPEVAATSYATRSAPGAALVDLPVAPVVTGFKNLATIVFDQAKIEYASGVTVNRVLVAEEAHSLVPEWNFVIGRYDSQEVAATCAIVLQSRKYGLRFVFVSQRTAIVSKSAISQCANYIVFRMVDETGLEYLSSVAGPSYVQVVRTLAPYQALVVGPAFSTSTPVVIDTRDWPRVARSSGPALPSPAAGGFAPPASGSAPF